MPFTGFPPSLFQFLSELKANNNKDWFEANRQRYEDEVRGPALAYITAMKKPIEKISPHFRVEAKKMGGSLMRIFRDTRFSKDKSPYKTNVGIHFRHAAGCDVHAPGFYLHIEPDEVFFGAGTWHPAGDSLLAIRTAIDKRRQDWVKARDAKAFRAQFELTGESLKRAPKGFEADHPLIEDLKRKDFIAVRTIDPGLISAPDFVRESAKAFRNSRLLMAFLCGAIGVDF